jgi:hypothetical protein
VIGMWTAAMRPTMVDGTICILSVVGSEVRILKYGLERRSLWTMIYY